MKRKEIIKEIKGHLKGMSKPYLIDILKDIEEHKALLKWVKGDILPWLEFEDEEDQTDFHKFSEEDQMEILNDYVEKETAKAEKRGEVPTSDDFTIKEEEDPAEGDLLEFLDERIAEFDAKIKQEEDGGLPPASSGTPMPKTKKPREEYYPEIEALIIEGHPGILLHLGLI